MEDLIRCGRPLYIKNRNHVVMMQAAPYTAALFTQLFAIHDLLTAFSIRLSLILLVYTDMISFYFRKHSHSFSVSFL